MAECELIVQTITTIGYGDIHPNTPIEKFIISKVLPY